MIKDSARDSLRVKFFPKLIEELWKIAKKRENPETLITRVMENVSNSAYTDLPPSMP